jgi:hypothetical protein
MSNLKSKILYAVKLSKQSRQFDAGTDTNGALYYFADRNAPVRYTKYADELCCAIEHTGWFCDPDQNEKCRGIVGAISHGRFLAGYELTDSGRKVFSPKTYDCEYDAAHAADEEARIYAEKEYEYQEAWSEGSRLNDLIEAKKADICDYWPARTTRRVRSDISEIIGDIRTFEKELANLAKRFNLSF